MSLFTKAAPKAERIKMYIYGPTGTGKTTTALHFPSPAVIDAERGTEHYGGSFDFYRLKTNNYKKVMEAADELLKDPGEFKSFIVDPMTVIYDSMLQEKEDQMKIKTGNALYELQPLDYKTIKNQVKVLMNKLLSLDMNVIVTARSKPMYAKGKFMEVIGEQPEGHKDFPYMFDIVLELFKGPKGTRMARVDKDRTNTLPTEFEFNYDAFVEAVGITSLERSANKDTQQENIRDKNNRTLEIEIDGEKKFTAGITAKTLTALKTALEGADQEALTELLEEQYGVDSLLDLTDKAGKALLSSIAANKED